MILTLTQKQRRAGALANSRNLSDYSVGLRDVHRARQILIKFTNGRKWIAKDAEGQQGRYA